MPEEKLRQLLDSKILSRHYKSRESEPYQKIILNLIIPGLLQSEENPRPTEKLDSN